MHVLKQFSDAKDRGDIVLNWEAGQTSAPDKRTIAGGRDIGNVVVRPTADKDVHYCFASSYDAAARRAGGSYPPGPKIAFTGGLESTITA